MPRKENRVFIIPLSVINLNSLQSQDFTNISLRLKTLPSSTHKLASQTCFNVAAGLYHYRKLADAQCPFLPKLRPHFKCTGLLNQFQRPINPNNFTTLFFSPQNIQERKIYNNNPLE